MARWNLFTITDKYRWFLLHASTNGFENENMKNNENMSKQ